MKTKTLTLFILLSLTSFGQSLNEVKYMDKIIDLIYENKANLEYIDSLESRLTACEHIRTESIKHDLEQNKALSVANKTIDLLVSENGELKVDIAKKERKLKNRWKITTGIVIVAIAIWEGGKWVLKQIID